MQPFPLSSLEHRVRTLAIKGVREPEYAAQAWRRILLELVNLPSFRSVVTVSHLPLDAHIDALGTALRSQVSLNDLANGNGIASWFSSYLDELDIDDDLRDVPLRLRHVWENESRGLRGLHRYQIKALLIREALHLNPPIRPVFESRAQRDSFCEWINEHNVYQALRQEPSGINETIVADMFADYTDTDRDALLALDARVVVTLVEAAAHPLPMPARAYLNALASILVSLTDLPARTARTLVLAWGETVNEVTRTGDDDKTLEQLSADWLRFVALFDSMRKDLPWSDASEFAHWCTATVDLMEKTSSK